MSIPQEGKMGQTWFQNRSIEIEVVRSDRFRDPIALTIAVQNLCAVLLLHFFGHYMRLLTII